MPTIQNTKDKILNEYDLETPLLRFQDASGYTEWNMRQSLESTLVLGNTGAGKSTTSSKLIAKKFLEAGYGSLVCTVKDTDASDWKKYCQETGRLKDLFVIRPNSGYAFDFLKHITSEPTNGTTYTQNIVSCLETVIEAAQNKNGQSRNSDTYWINAMHELLTNAVNICLLAYDYVSVENLYDIVTSAPKKTTKPLENGFDDFFRKTFEEAHRKVDIQVFRLIDSLPFAQKERLKDPTIFNKEIPKIIPEVRSMKLLDKFFFETYRTLAEKTRSIVDSSVTGFLFCLLQEPVFSLFSNEDMNYSPLDCCNGKIIVLDLPVKIYEKAGQDCQTLFKYCFQKTMEKRDIKKNGRPVFLFADECQNFLHPYDTSFQATCRSSRVATVYITQNLGNFYSCMPGEKSEHLVNSLISTLSTKIFHCNSDVETNNWASELFGEAYIEEYSLTDTLAENISMSRSKSFQLRRMVRPESFGRLSTGGPAHNYMAEAYVFMQGKKFHDGFNHRKIVFHQIK